MPLPPTPLPITITFFLPSVVSLQIVKNKGLILHGKEFYNSKIFLSTRMWAEKQGIQSFGTPKGWQNGLSLLRRLGEGGSPRYPGFTPEAIPLAAFSGSQAGIHRFSYCINAQIVIFSRYSSQIGWRGQKEVSLLITNVPSKHNCRLMVNGFCVFHLGQHFRHFRKIRGVVFRSNF